MASMSERVCGSVKAPEEKVREEALTPDRQSADITLRAIDGSETTRRALVADDEALYISDSGVFVVADGDPSDDHETIFSRDDMRSCQELYVDGKRALERRTFLLWD